MTNHLGRHELFLVEETEAAIIGSGIGALGLGSDFEVLGMLKLALRILGVGRHRSSVYQNGRFKPGRANALRVSTFLVVMGVPQNDPKWMVV